MKENCPHCGKTHDVPIKRVLEWIESSEKLRKAVQALLMHKARAAKTPESQKRDVDYSALARKSHEARRKNKAVETHPESSPLAQEAERASGLNLVMGDEVDGMTKGHQ